MEAADADAVTASFLASLDFCDTDAYPFRHWLLDRVLPDAVCAAIDALPVVAPPIADTEGKRETHNSTRIFFGTPQRAAYPVCSAIASALQSDAVVRRVEQCCDVVLGGSFLRIEYCLDTDGFWLEPHTDIGAKLFTMLVYLSDDPGSEAWGTDLLDGPDRLVATMPYRRNSGCIFIPATNSWHGFHRRPIAGVRRSLIVNYVGPEWRSRHELAFPEQPVLLEAGRSPHRTGCG
jgi:hypothetical protein